MALGASMNIYQKINEVRKKVDYIRKEKAVQNYKAVTHDQVTAILREHLIDQGIIIVPNLKSAITVDTGEKTSKGSPIIRVESEYVMDFINMDDPSDRFQSAVSAHANDTGDKAPGKALSYAKKAVALKIFEIETGEDEESRYSASDVDTESLISIINSSDNMEELKASFKAAIQSCGNDKESLKQVISAKDAKKKILENGTKN